MHENATFVTVWNEKVLSSQEWSLIPVSLFLCRSEAQHVWLLFYICQLHCQHTGLDCWSNSLTYLMCIISGWSALFPKNKKKWVVKRSRISNITRRWLCALTEKQIRKTLIERCSSSHIISHSLLTHTILVYVNGHVVDVQLTSSHSASSATVSTGW